MGGGFSFVVKGLDGAFQGISGKVVGSSGETDVEIEVSGKEAGLPAGIYVVDSTKGTAVRAILSDEAFEDAPEVDLDNASRTHDGSFTDVNDVTLIDAPSGWTRMTSGPDRPPMSKVVFKSDDGYFVEETYSGESNPFDGEKFTVRRADLYGDLEDYYSWSRGDFVGNVDSWAEIQALVNSDSDDYQEAIKTAQDFKENPQKYLAPIRPVKAKTEQSSIEEKIAIAEAANSAVTQEHIDSLQKALTSLFSKGDVSDEEVEELTNDVAAAFDGVILKDKNGKEVRLEISYKSAQMTRKVWDTDDFIASASFNGHYVDVETNEVIGDFSRVITVLTGGKVTVNNSSMHVKSDHQSRGIGSAMNARNEVLYSHTGVSEVTTSGTSSRAAKPGDKNYIGATHWARSGFDWESEDDRMSTVRGVEAAVIAWNSGQRTNKDGNPLFDSDSQVEDVINLVTKAIGESFDDENRVTAGELVRWPGADAWFADNWYQDGERSEFGSVVKYKKEITPAEGSTFKLEKAPEPEAAPEPEPEAAPESELEPETPAPAEAETSAPSVEETAARVGDVIRDLQAMSAGMPNIKNWTKVGERAGSNPGGIYEDLLGKRYYVKTAKSRRHAENEVLASALYRALGVDAVGVFFAYDSSDMDNPLRTISPIVDTGDDGLLTHLRDEEYLDKIRENFMVDVWLANWDVAGLSYDNIITNANGDPVRVDPGGALLYRAQGEPKGDLFSSEMNEQNTLRDRSVNQQSSLIFMDTTREQKKSGASKVLSLSPKQISDIIGAVVTDSQMAEELKTKLNERRRQMLTLGLDLLDPFAKKPKPASEVERIKLVQREGVKLESDVTRFSPETQLLYPALLQLDSDDDARKILIEGGLVLSVNLGGKKAKVTLTVKEVKAALKKYLSDDVETRVRNVGNKYLDGAALRAAQATWLLLNGQIEESSALLQSVIADYDAALLQNTLYGAELVALVQSERDGLVKLFNGLKNDGVIDEEIIPDESNEQWKTFFSSKNQDFREYVTHDDPPEWYDGSASDLFKEVYGSSVETNLGKLEKISIEDFDAMGVSPFYDAAPLELDQSDFENVPSIREAISTVATTNRSKEDSLMDGGDIEDGRVTFAKTMHVSDRDMDYLENVDPDNPDFERKLTASFKLTSWAGDRLDAVIREDTSSSWTNSGVVGFQPKQLGKKGFQYYDKPRRFRAAREEDMELGNSGENYTYADPDGRFTVSFTNRATSSKSLHNAVEITFSSLDPSDQDIKDAFKVAGVKDPRPARVEDVRIIAENRLISVLGNVSAEQRGEDKNEYLTRPNYNPRKLEREEILERIKKTWDVTADDVEMTIGDNGLLEMKLPSRVAEDLAQFTGVEVFQHSFTMNVNWRGGDPPDKIPKEVAEKIIKILLGSEDGSIVSGLQSTHERYGSGVQVEGMSSSNDMRTGGADYVYLTPGTSDGLKQKNAHALGYGPETTVIAEFDAPDVLRRADFWANVNDAFGSRDGHSDPVDSLTTDSYEFMLKRHVPAGVISRMYVHDNVKAAVIARLKEFNITTMFGIPLDEFFVSAEDMKPEY
jgi:hypothetical protein